MIVADPPVGTMNIYYYDILSGNRVQVTDEPGIQYLPSIYKNKMVWMDDRDNTHGIYSYDFLTGEETYIPSLTYSYPIKTMLYDK